MTLSKTGGGQNKPYLVHIETHIVDHCNLNCKSCNNFSPFVRQRSCASAEQWDKDIGRLANVYDIRRILLLGGEPLLEPKLAEEFITVTRKHAPTSEVYLLTNGLLIPKMTDDFFETLVKNDIIVSISAYVPTMKMMPQIWEVLESHDVKYLYHKVLTFSKHLNLDYVPNVGFENFKRGSCGCYYMRNGHISKCPDAMLIEHMDKFLGTNFRSRCDISLDEVESNPILTLQRLNTNIDLCHYCGNKLTIFQWKPVEGIPKIEDWLA